MLQLNYAEKVSFHDAAPSRRTPKTPSHFLIRLGLVETLKGANKVSFLILFGCVFILLFIFAQTLLQSNNKIKDLPPRNTPAHDNNS